MKKKILLSSVLTIALCFCLIAGSTYALFTSETEVNIAVTAGKVDVSATINEGLKTWSLKQTEADAKNGPFVNGGFAKIEDGVLKINQMTPGDVVKFSVDVTNSSNVAVKYRVKASSAVGDNGIDLTDALECKVVIDGNVYTMTQTAKEFSSEWFEVDASVAIPSIAVKVTFPNGTPDHDNLFQNGTANIAFTLEAVQANGVDGNGNLIVP